MYVHLNCQFNKNKGNIDIFDKSMFTFYKYPHILKEMSLILEFRIPTFRNSVGNGQSVCLVMAEAFDQ